MNRRTFLELATGGLAALTAAAATPLEHAARDLGCSMQKVPSGMRKLGRQGQALFVHDLNDGEWVDVAGVSNIRLVISGEEHFINVHDQ